MGTKTISITDEAYDILKSRKNINESFSEAIVKLSGKKRLASFAGTIGPISSDALERSILEGRKMHRKRKR